MRDFARVPWWLVLLCFALCAVGLAFVHSASFDDDQFGHQAAKQALLDLVGAGAGFLLLWLPYSRIQRSAWPLYGATLGALLLLPVFGSVVNGARRWFALPGFSLQPSELAKLAVIVALAAWLRFRSRARTFEGLLVPGLITAVPAGLVMLQPDLGSSLVFWPILFAVSYAAGASGRSLLLSILLGAGLALLLYAVALQPYQRLRVDTWLDHFSWEAAGGEQTPAMREAIRGPAYQPWQSLVAIGSGGVDGFGYAQGPQNRYAFLPYRSSDYIAAVVAEETGLCGLLGLLGLQLALVVGLFVVALRTRERFGRLVVVGVATWIGAQSLMHVAVCAWFVPATGLPMPFVSAGGSSTVAALLGVALAVRVAARREPVLAGDGYD